MRIQAYLGHYLKLTPIQLAIIRAQEASLMAEHLRRLKRPILEIGCSDGAFGDVLFGGKPGAIDVGLDIDAAAIDLGRSIQTYRRMVVADVRKLPFGNRSFGMVFSNQSLEHVDGIDQALSEIARVTKPGGLFVFLVPTVFLDDYWITSSIPKALGFRRLAAFLHEKRNKVFCHYNLLSIDIWRKKLRKFGFAVTFYRYAGSIPRYLVSELFQPLRLPQFLIWRFFHRRVLVPRWLVTPVAMVLETWIEQGEKPKPRRGPTVLIVARKGAV